MKKSSRSHSKKSRSSMAPAIFLVLIALIIVLIEKKPKADISPDETPASTTKQNETKLENDMFQEIILWDEGTQKLNLPKDWTVTPEYYSSSNAGEEGNSSIIGYTFTPMWAEKDSSDVIRWGGYQFPGCDFIDTKKFMCNDAVGGLYTASKDERVMAVYESIVKQQRAMSTSEE